MKIKDIVEQYKDKIIQHKTCLVCLNSKQDDYMHYALFRGNDKFRLYINMYHCLDIDDDMSSVANNSEIDCDVYQIINIDEIDNYIRHNIQLSTQEHEKHENNNYHFIKDEIEKDGGKIVKFYDDEHGILISASSTDEDFYYNYITLEDDLSLKMNFSSCVGGYEIVEDEELSEYAKRNVDNIQQFIDTYFKEHIIDVVFTKIKVIP